MRPSRRRPTRRVRTARGQFAVPERDRGGGRGGTHRLVGIVFSLDDQPDHPKGDQDVADAQDRQLVGGGAVRDRRVGLVASEVDPGELRAHRDAFCAGIREFNARGPSAGKWWTVQFLIRRCAWHMLDHAWEMEDRDLSNGS